MSEPFLAEIKIVGFNFAPRGFAYCDGQILPINQNQSLYSLLGTTYGGDGRTTFALPDLRSRAPLHDGDGYVLGESTGSETVSLNINQIPAHTHSLNATDATPASSSAADNLPATAGGGRTAVVPYTGPTNLVALNAASIGNTGGSQGHDNMQPYLTLAFVIALSGLFPSRN